MDFVINSLKIKGERDFVTGSVEVLGDNVITHAERDSEGLKITLGKKPESDKPICFKIEIM